MLFVPRHHLPVSFIFLPEKKMFFISTEKLKNDPRLTLMIHVLFFYQSLLS